MKISINTFGGVMPRVSPRLLPETAAVEAKNVSLENGYLAPLRAGMQAIDQNGANFFVPTGTKTIYLHRNRDGSKAWLASSALTDLAPSPVREDPWDRLYYTAEGLAPKFSLGTEIVTNAATNYQPVASHILGVPKPTTAPGATVTTSGTSTDAPSARGYVFAFVSGLGEEGPPSDASPILDVKTDDTVTITFSDAVPAAIYNTGPNPAKRRIYRTNATGSFQFVKDVLATAPSTTDAILDESLGETLSDVSADQPPATDPAYAPGGALQGLTAMPNGIFSGFSDRTLFFSEAYLPHAWPKLYSLTTRYKVMGLASISIGLIVLTNGKPAMASGSSPASMTLVEVDTEAACVASRTIVDMGEQALYAGPDGIVAAGEGGFQNVTSQFFTREQWQALVPETMTAYRVNGQYWFFYSNGTEGGYALDLRPQTPILTRLDFYVTAGFHDPQDGVFYGVIKQAVGPYPVRAFSARGDTTSLQYEWRSKILRVENPVNPSCGIVDAEEYTGVVDPVSLQPSIKLELYADGQLVHTQYARDDEMFRLPDGYRANTFQVRVIGTGRINAIHLAEEPQELLQ